MDSHLEQLPNVLERPSPRARASAFKPRLLAMRARLMGTVGSSMGMLSDEIPAGSDDRVNAAQLETAQRTERGILESSSGTIEQIDIALKRLQSGTHDKCEECGVTIPVSRHNAIPYATTCVECAAKTEGSSLPPAKPKAKRRAPRFLREA